MIGHQDKTDAFAVRLSQLIGRKVNDNAFDAIVVKNFPPFVTGEIDKMSMAF